MHLVYLLGFLPCTINGKQNVLRMSIALLCVCLCTNVLLILSSAGKAQSVADANAEVDEFSGSRLLT